MAEIVKNNPPRNNWPLPEKSVEIKVNPSNLFGTIVISGVTGMSLPGKTGSFSKMVFPFWPDSVVHNYN